MAFFFEVAVTGLMVGIMYSLIAIGFVLIFLIGWVCFYCEIPESFSLD